VAPASFSIAGLAAQVPIRRFRRISDRPGLSPAPSELRQSILWRRIAATFLAVMLCSPARHVAFRPSALFTPIERASPAPAQRFGQAPRAFRPISAARPSLGGGACTGIAPANGHRITLLCPIRDKRRAFLFSAERSQALCNRLSRKSGVIPRTPSSFAVSPAGQAHKHGCDLHRPIQATMRREARHASAWALRPKPAAPFSGRAEGVHEGPRWISPKGLARLSRVTCCRRQGSDGNWRDPDSNRKPALQGGGNPARTALPFELSRRHQPQSAVSDTIAIIPTDLILPAEDSASENVFIYDSGQVVG
jgi:hypothetical protein